MVVEPNRCPQVLLAVAGCALGLLVSGCHRILDRAERHPKGELNEQRPSTGPSPYSTASSESFRPEAPSSGGPEASKPGIDSTERPKASRPPAAAEREGGMPATLQLDHPATPPVFSPKEDKPPRPIVKALQCFLDGKPEQAIQWLGDYESRDQELLLRL